MQETNCLDLNTEDPVQSIGTASDEIHSQQTKFVTQVQFP